MEEKIKSIIGGFLKIPAGQINNSTIIDRTVMNSSIQVHRMYAKLAADGIMVKDYQEVVRFRDLLGKLISTDQIDGAIKETLNSDMNSNRSIAAGSVNTDTGIGIDMELVSNMPLTNDFREDSFYLLNFSQREIAYCILQANPYASFAGLFALKEAIVKADNNYRSQAFNNIIIFHSPEGKPLHPSFMVSISHTDLHAIAIALPLQNTPATSGNIIHENKMKGNSRIPFILWMMAIVSFILSIVSLYLLLTK